MADGVRFRLNEEDMVHGARLFALVSMRQRRTLISLAVLFVLILLALSFIVGIIFPFDMERLAHTWHIVVAGTLLPYVIVFVLSVVVGPMQARRIYRQQKSLQGELALRWTSERLEIESEYGAFAMPWAHFVRFGEDSNGFVLFESDRLYRIIPKRVLDAEAMSDLRSRLVGIGA